jgi:hypothetical protein
MELFVKRFPSGISSTTHLAPPYLEWSQYEVLVSPEFGDYDTASQGGGSGGSCRVGKRA